MAYAVAMKQVSGRTNAEIEEALKIDESPAGNRWSRYCCGKRTLTEAQRKEYTRKAVEAGLIPQKLSGIISLDAQNALGWRLEGRTLESVQGEYHWLMLKQKKMEEAARKCVDAIDALRAVVEGHEEYWAVGHEDYAYQNQNDLESPEAWRLVLGHQFEFEKELATIREKICALNARYEFVAKRLPLA
ncbi:hypothetical protein GCM10027296_29450 [Chitinimonas naiadis]